MNPKNYVIGVIAILAVFGILWGTGSLSVIGEGVTTKESCRINESTSDCTIELILPEYRELADYTLDLDFSKVAGEFGNSVQVSPQHALGPLIEEGDKELASAEEELQTNYVYLYRLPNNWDTTQIYAVGFDASSQGWVKNTDPDASVEIDLWFGTITMPYTQSTLLKCAKDCDTSKYIVRHYLRDSNPDEWRFYLYNNAFFGGSRSDLDTDDRDYQLYSQMNGLVSHTGSFVLQEALDKYGMASADELGLILYLEVDERMKGYTDFSISVPPKVFLTYAPSLRPTDTKLFIGSEAVDTFSGQPDNATTRDLAKAINDYCQRESTTGRCSVPLRFASSEEGIVTVEAENADLRALTGAVKTPGAGNLLTGGVVTEFFGNSFDFSGHPTQAYSTVAVIALLVIGGILLIPVGGKKK